MAAITSILKTVKKAIEIDEEETVFDAQLILIINAAFFTLNSIGCIQNPVVIQDDTEEWSIISLDPGTLSAVKSFVFLKTRLAFDPPANASMSAALTEGVNELIWRLKK